MTYTFADHARRCHEAAQRREVLVQFVQVKVSGATACGCIDDAWTTPTGIDFFRVELVQPFIGLSYYRPDRVRQCSGLDGRCACAGEEVLS